MAAPERFAETSDSSCIAVAVHTWHFVCTYVVSLAAVLSLGFLLLVSLVLMTALAAGGKYIAPYVPEVAMHALGSALSFGTITLLFAMMFKWLPETYVAWRDVWPGAAVTAALFEIGKLLIGLYIGKQALEIDVWRGGLPRRSADLGVLLLATRTDGRGIPARLSETPRRWKYIGFQSPADRCRRCRPLRPRGGRAQPLRRSPGALLVGWLLARLEVRNQRARGTTAA